jgi:hypothetical protein
MRRILIPLAGLATFVAVYVVLQPGASRPAPVAPTAAPTPVNALATRLDADHVAVGLPTGSAAPLVTGLAPGARLNVLASLQDPDTGRPLTAVIARGATVIQADREPLLVSVDPSDAIALAHLVLGGTSLSYAVWAGGQPPADTPPMDERTARALLGLPAPTPTPSPEPTQPPATATPVPSPTPLPVRTSAAADRYVVQPGDTLSSIAVQLGIDRQRMHEANPNVSETEELPAGMQLVVPQ